MKSITTVQRSEDLVIQLPPDKFKPGEKVSVSLESDGSLRIAPLVELELDIPDELFLKLALEAHKLDITFNEYVSLILDQRLTEAGC
jgi:hypothetical protein